MKDGLEATTVSAADDVADATTLPAQRNPGARRPVLAKPLKLTQIEVVALSQNASSKSRECVWLWNRMAVRWGSLWHRLGVGLPAVG